MKLSGVLCAGLLASVLAVFFFAGSSPARSETPATKLLGFARWYEDAAYVTVVGGYNTDRRKWLSDSAAQSAFYPGTKFQLFHAGHRVGNVVIERPRPTEVTAGYVADVRQKPTGQGMAVAVANIANPSPRRPREQALDNSVYRLAVAALLRSAGLKVEKARLQQHWRVDLNGDGIEEVLLGAQSRGEMGTLPFANKGDYSIAALRFYDPSRRGNKVQTVSLGTQIIKERIDFGAPLGYELLACVDVNGDSALEIVVRSFYYEGEGIDVFAFDGRRARRVLSAGWGA